MQNTGIESLDCPELNSIEIFCNQVAAEVLVPKKELLKTVKLQTLVDDLPRLSKAFHVSPEVIMRRLLTFGAISKHDYENYRNNQLVKYRNIPAKTGGFAHYPHRLLNASGEHFARTAFAAYHKDKITLSELASVFSNCDTKHLTEIESSISNESAV